MNMKPESIEDWATPTLKEAPYWREGMSPEEYDEEREYYYSHFQEWLDCSYEPLWKQRAKAQ